MSYQGVIEKYRKYLPVRDETPVITLLEGNTPLIKADNLASSLGVKFGLFLKYEGMNPTGSFKDRGMTVAVSRAKEKGAQAVICASTGNTAASASAYAARAGMRCIVVIPEGAIALGKLSQSLIHNAHVIAISGNFDQALNLVKGIVEKYPVTLVNSLNPDRIEGQKTASFEILDVLGKPPDYQFMPVGNAGNITAYWQGYKEAVSRYTFNVSRLPKMMGFQAEGSAPIVKGHSIDQPRTIATAIRIGNPASWKRAEKARDESGGVIDTVTDEEIIEAYKLLAKTEGIFVEPASAASVAGLKKYIGNGFFHKKEGQRNTAITVVCILTGHGLKDPDCAIKNIEKPRVVKPELSAVVREMAL